MLVSQLCLTLWDPLDCSPPGSSVHEILQASILEGVAISFSRGSSPTQGSDPGIKPRSLALQADSLPTEIQGKPSEDVGRFLSPVFFIKVVFCPSKLYQNMKKPFLRLQLSGRKDKCVHLCMLVTQPCLTVCNPMDCSSIHGILSRQESWSGVPFPSPGDLPNPGIKPRFPELQIVSFTS